jgi:hypothetical protein
MKSKTALLAALLLLAFVGKGQDISGPWYGLLKTPLTQLRVVFNLSKTPDGYTSTMDSPDQGAKGIPVTSTSFENGILHIELKNARIDYTGTLGKDNTITGTFNQAGQSFVMNLSHTPIEKETLLRPQEPLPPFSYYTEEVKFENAKANVVLAGTLSLPAKEGKFPVVILITGSGPQNRNEELLGHKPFLVLADYLTKKGIAVLRYDDRGTAESTGSFKSATTLDFASDVEAAVTYLLTRKEINAKQIGLIGHSEGGIIAPIVAAKSKDIRFIVLLAGTGIPGEELLLMQKALIEQASGMTESDIKNGQLINKGAFDIICKSQDPATVKDELSAYYKQTLKDDPESKPAGMTNEDYINTALNQLTGVWMQFFIRYNPALVLKDVKCPVLALGGSKDLQVPAKINLEAIRSGLEKGGNKNVTIKELPNLNHLFQECETGSPTEYAKIEQTFSPTALSEISNWILALIK